MGYSSVADMLEMTDRDTALRWHLSANIYPPYSGAFPYAQQAIDAILDGEPQRRIKGTGKLQGWSFSASEIASRFHLEAFIDYGLRQLELEAQTDGTYDPEDASASEW